MIKKYGKSFEHGGHIHIRAVAALGLRHRIILNFEGEAEGPDNDAIVEEILNSQGFEMTWFDVQL